MRNIAFALGFVLCASPTFASEEPYLFDLHVKNPTTATPTPPALSAAEIWARTQQVFQYYQVQAEADMQGLLDGVADHTTQAELAHWLPYFDAGGKQFDRYFSVDSNGKLTGFWDRDSKQSVDYTADPFLLPSLPPSTIHQPNPLPNKPLNGLRIALDPGHMGTTYWDQETGKFSKDAKGNVVSEGLINTQVVLLLQQYFTGLGATVMVTRDQLQPVTATTLAALDLQEFGRRELRERSLEPWFQTLLATTDPTARDKAFDASSEVKSIFSEDQRPYYFIEREDLDARSAMIMAFHPDLTLVIHFDAEDNVQNPAIPDKTRGYVPGGMDPTEWANSVDRAEMAAHAMQPDQMQGSVDVTSKIVSHISKSLNIPIPTSDIDGTIEIEPGVFARNLKLNHDITEGLLSYMECAVYENGTEFTALQAKDYTMQIGGQSYPYSKRLLAVAEAIRDGVLEYYGAN